MDEAKKELFAGLKVIMSIGKKRGISEKDLMRQIFTDFSIKGKEKGMHHLMIDAFSEFIITEYPHLKEDLNKLLILV